MKTPWFVGAKSPEMKCPLRYEGWGAYQPRGRESRKYAQWKLGELMHELATHLWENRGSAIGMAGRDA